MLPDQFVGISVRRIGRKIKQPQRIAEACDERPGLRRAMCRAAIGEIVCLASATRRFWNSMKIEALSPAIPLIMKHMRPRAMTAAINLMPYLALVACMTGVAPFLPQVLPT